MRTLGYFAFRDLFHDRGRSLLTILGLAVVAVGYLLLSALSQAYLVFGKQPQVTDNLTIISAEAIDPMESSLHDDVLETALQIAPDQILRVFPSIFRHLRIGGQAMQVRAVPLAEMRSSLALTLLEGEWPGNQEQIVISEGVVQITPWKIGSLVNIYGTDFQVTGIIRAGGNKFASVWMTYDQGQRLFDSRSDFQIGFVQLQPSADPESVRAMLQADPRLPSEYAVYLESTVSNRLGEITKDLAKLSIVQAVASLLAISFGTYNAANLSLTERSHEIVILRVLGFSQGKLRMFLLLRTLAMTLVAYFAGLVVAITITNYQQVHAPISLHAAPLVLKLTPSSSILGLALTSAFAFLGVWLTTGRISELSLSTRGT